MTKHVLCALALFLFETGAYSADFTCASGNTACLIAAIQTANANGQDNAIFLEAGAYEIVIHDNVTNGPNGLPSITGRMSIRGPDGIGSTIENPSDIDDFRLFHIAPGGNLTLDWLALTRGRVGSLPNTPPGFGGGAILNEGTLTINRNAIYNNTTSFRNGGAIDNRGSLAISHSEIRNNHAERDGGGGIVSIGSLSIEDTFIVSNTSDFGGGIWLPSGQGVLLRTTIAGNNDFGFGGGGISNGGTLSIQNSTLRENSSSGVRGGGGGIFNSGVLDMTSSTVSGNGTIFIGTRGAGIRNTGNMFLKNVTIAENAALEGFDGGISNTGTARLQNTILALNSRILVPGGPVPSDCNSISSLGNNLIGSLDGCTVQLRMTDLVTNPLLNDFTEVPNVAGSGHFPLQLLSPAVNRGNEGACTPRDQLGRRRLGICDIGAIERRLPGL